MSSTIVANPLRGSSAVSFTPVSNGRAASPNRATARVWSLCERRPLPCGVASRSACSASRRALDELLTCRARSRRALLLIRSARCPWIAPPSGVTTSSHRWRSAPLRGLRAPAAASRLGVSMACSASRRALDELRACRARSRRALLPINSARRPWIAPQSGVTTSSRRWRSAALRAFRAPAAAVRCGVSIGVLGVTASS